MIQKIIVLNIIVYKNPGSRRKRFLRFFPFKKIHCRLFCIAFSSRESSKPLPFNCGWAVIYYFTYTLKELMLINQKWEKQTCFGNRNSVTASKERPLATGTSVAREMVTRHRCYSACPYPTPSLVWYPLDWCHEWKVFKYLIFPVCPRKKGQCSCDWFSKAKLGREERKSGHMGEHGQIAMLRRGSLGEAWAMK